MFRNYFLIAIRNILRHKFYSIINILGLAIGLACFITIGLWVKDELSYDKHFKNADRIYRIENSLVTSGEPTPMAASDPRIAEHVREEYPEVENIVRILQVPTLLSNNDQNFFEEKTFYADSTFFDIFSFQFVAGNPKNALQTKGSIVITESIAKKLFGDEDPIGKTLYINNVKTKKERIAHIVTGVIKENNFNSHFHTNAIIAKFHYMESFELTYVLFRQGYDPKRFEDHVWKEIYNKYFKEEYKGDNQDIPLNRLQPLTKIHLSDNVWGDMEPNGSITTVYIFSIIGIFILLIASINYMNLATARSYSRSREVGVRKVLGATKKQLVIQFLTESVAISILALILALAFVEITLPVFNKLSDKTLTIQLLDPVTLVTVVVLAVFVGAISGVYPAFFVSSFLPIRALKGTLDVSKNKPTLRKTLVVIQFSLSIIMLIATMVIARQLKYVKNYDLGFNKEQVLVVNMNDPKMSGNTESIKAELLKNPDILKVAGSYNIPGGELNHSYIKFESPNGMEARLINSMFVDYDYVDVMGLKLLDGKGFEKDMIPQLDTFFFVIVNESALKMLGWTYGNGKKTESGTAYGFKRGRCVGVIKDFHAASLHENIAPMAFTLSRKSNYLSIKIRAGNISKTISYIEQVYKSFTQGYPFEYNFLDESFNKQYEKEEKENILFNWFAGLCIFISCLGLMGLASFTTRQRTKEISIRKISGASVSNIVFLLATDFIKLVVIAFFIAMPIAYYAMNKWLQNFAYHTDIGWGVFVLAGIIALLIAAITISIHTIHAANKNPATVLKHE